MRKEAAILCMFLVLAAGLITFLPAQQNQNNFGGGVSVSGAVTAGHVATFVNGSTIQDGGATGSGTVTNTGGSLTSNSVVLGAGTNDTKVSTGITTNGASELDLGLNGTASGVLGFNGSTSGKATLTAPAVAGTTTNPIASTNAISVPAGAANGPALLVGTGSGLYQRASNVLDFTVNSTGVWEMQLASNSIVFGGSTGVYAWNSGGLNTATDTGLSRAAPAVVSVGTSTQGDESGLIRAGNACRVTADITLPVNTATTVCSWSLPAVAKAWGWQCQIPWVISAGSGTNTLAIIANPSQTPTGATNGSAEIKTTNTNTATEATTAVSASGGTTLLTSPTITPAATVFMSSTSGTLLASGTAGTFAIQMTAAGTTATAAAKAGATCTLY